MQINKQSGQFQLPSLLLLIALFLTGLFSGIILLNAVNHQTAKPDTGTNIKTSINHTAGSSGTIASPFRVIKQPAVNKKNHIANRVLKNAIQKLKNRVSNLEEKLAALSLKILKSSAIVSQRNNTVLPNNFPLYTLDRLLQGGINETLATEIIRKQNSNALKRLELQDRARRQGYFNTRRYQNELTQLAKKSINLRKELGDEAYDQYLFRSSLNNRIKVLSVMPGSAAQQAGIQKNDIIQDYNGKKMFSWDELKSATAKGHRDEYVTIDVLRHGELFSLSIPRGPMGIQLGATRIKP